MVRAAKEWNAYKTKHGIVTGGTKKVAYSESSSNSSSSSSTESSSNSSGESMVVQGKVLQPRAYRTFVSAEMKRQRALHPGLENKEYMARAAKVWAVYKVKHGMDTGIKKTDTSSSSSCDSSSCSSSCSSSESDEMPIKAVPKKAAITKAPPQKSAYQTFVAKEMKKQRALNPGLENRQYMSLAAKAWGAYKTKHGIDTSNTKTAVTNTDTSSSTIESDSSEDSDEKPQPIMSKSEYMSLAAKQWTAQKNTKKEATASDSVSDSASNSASESDEDPKVVQKKVIQESPYQTFIAGEMKRQRQLNPNLSNMKYMQLAAQEWGKQKKK
jgi:hypothetical protein